MANTKSDAFIKFANPYLVCNECGKHVEGMRGGTRENVPCGHPVGVTSTCPSWRVGAGCVCKNHLGNRPHA